MKIRAVRLAETGPFIQPVAVEGFSGRFDVLTGPNEAGKSTLLTALAMLLGEKHTSTAKSIAALRPDSGGTPLIEADLDLAGRIYRLRKRYLAQRSAELVELGSGQVWRGADAETEIERLLGGEQMRALRGLIWVEQGASFTLPGKGDAGLASGLAELIEQEAADSSGTGAARRLAALVRARLAEVVTSAHGKAKVGGDLHAAIKLRDELADALAAARSRASAVDARRHRLDAMRLELATCSDQAAQAALMERVQQSAKAVIEVDRARERLRAADERVKARQLAVDKAQQEQARLARAMSEAERLGTAIASGEAEIASLNQEIASLDVELQSAGQERERLGGEVEELRRVLERAQVAALAAAQRAACEDAARRLADARLAVATIAGVTARIETNPVTAEEVGKAQKLSTQLAVLEAQVAAQAPAITMAYLATSEARVSIGGSPVPAGVEVRIERATEIVIEGVGTMTIAPGNAGATVAADERDQCRAELAELLLLLGVEELGELNARLSARRQDEALIAAERRRLESLAPRGIGEVEAAFAAADAALLEHTAMGDGACGGGVGVVDPTRARATFEVLRVRFEEAVRSHDKLQSRVRSAGERLSIARERVEAGRRRRDEIDAEIGPGTAYEETAATLARSVDTKAGELNEAVREQSGWRDAVPDGAGYTALVTAADMAKSEAEQAGQRQKRIEQEVAEILGALRRDGEDGSGADVPRLEDALAEAQARVDDLQLDTRALQVLADRLERVGSDQRSLVLRPVIERLQPMLMRLFPDARVALEGPLLIASLEREGRADTMTRLSGGTREQVATLVRLAYAGLMVERHKPLPLVLDDALVFSDDTRLEIVMEMLAESALRHQVVMLSCHQRAIDPLVAAHGGNRLEIVPWIDVDGAGHGGPQGGRKKQKDRAERPVP